MDEQTKMRCAARAQVLKAMAHASRLIILEELSGGERCVCELRDIVDADTSTVSKHLSILKNAGLIEDDKRGTKVFYRLSVPCILRFFDCVESVIHQRASKDMAAITLADSMVNRG